VVPQAAVMPMDNQVFVFVVDARGRVRKEAVRVLARSPRFPNVAVAGNLEPGDRVVLMPMGLETGQSVRTAAREEDKAAGAGR
jgi:hypothetical protein